MKKIKTYSIFTIGDETAEQGVLTYREVRDVNGNILLEEEYYLDESLSRRVERTFSESGQLLEEKFYTQPDDWDQHSIYHYADSGKIEKIRTIFSGGGVELRQYQHDEAKGAETILIGDESGNIESKEFRRTDAEGKILEESMYEGAHTLVQEIKTSYGDHGRPVSRSITYEDGFTTDLTYEYEYDEQGRVIGSNIKNQNDEELYYEEFEYDERNNIAEHYVENKERRLTYQKKYEYDDQDRMTKEQTYNQAEALEQEIHLEYGADGRPTKKETSTAQGLVTELYRFEYFD